LENPSRTVLRVHRTEYWKSQQNLENVKHQFGFCHELCAVSVFSVIKPVVFGVDFSLSEFFFDRVLKKILATL
jgi:hypothetical protein